jgi:methionine-rich copper-binding protein CopC
MRPYSPVRGISMPMFAESVRNRNRSNGRRRRPRLESLEERCLLSVSGGSTPYGGTAWAIPGTIQAENFDNGGEGVAYKDTTAGNSGGAYRNTDVDIQGTSDSGGGYNVGWIAPTEWLNYTVNVAASGTYQLSLRVASSGQGGKFHVDFGGVNATGTLTIPNTGGWQNWQTITTNVHLTAGQQIMQVDWDTNGASGYVGNLNWVTVNPAIPRVTSNSPASGATGVAVAATPSATFNEAVQGVTFTLTNSSGTAVSGTPSYNSTTHVETFTPTAALAYGTKYTATVRGAKDADGDPMNGSTSWSFTTDPLKPAVTSHLPASSATGVAVAATPSATFNEAVQFVTFTLTNSSGTAVAGTPSYNSTTHVETFTPTAALAYGTKYTATVRGAKDAAGDLISGPFSWSFTTDPAAPKVNSDTPASGATNVAQSTTATATFNEAIQPNTITFTLTPSGGSPVAAHVTYNSSTFTATLTPSAALAADTTYTASITGAKDIAGDPMSGRFSWTFTTDAPTAPTAPAGTTYWVSNSGSNSNSGSEASPWQTLQFAANQLAAGDTLDVEAGTYAGFSVGYSTSPIAGTSTSPITVQGAPGTSPSAVIIASEEPDRANGIDLEPGSNYWTISGLSIINSNGQFTAEGILIASSHVNILNSTITGDGNNMNYAILTSGSYLTIQGNSVSETTGTGGVGHGIYCGNATHGQNITNIDVIGNTIFSCSEHGLQINGVFDSTEAATNCVIEGNVIYNITGGSGMNLDTVQHSIISNNLIYNYDIYGIALYADNTGATDNIIVNNTILAGTTGRYGALSIGTQTDASSGNTVLNNILLGAGNFGTAILVGSSASLSGLVSNYNVVGTSSSEATFSVDFGNSSESWASWTSGTGQDKNSVVGALSALFVNSSSNNYQEATGSPSIGAGTSTDAPSTDILGNPRPSSFGYDIGAYEYEGTGSVVVASTVPAGGATNAAVSSPVNGLGTAQISPLPSTIQTTMVASSGPVGGSAGGGLTNVVLSVSPGATDPATSSSGTTSNQTDVKSSLTRSGSAESSMTALQISSVGTSQGVTESSKLVKDKTVEALLPESLLELLSRDSILSNQKKSSAG